MAHTAPPEVGAPSVAGVAANRSAAGTDRVKCALDPVLTASIAYLTRFALALPACPSACS
jgi:hypothetical protein